MSKEEVHNQILKTFKVFKDEIELGIYRERMLQPTVICPIYIAGYSPPYAEAHYDQELVKFTKITYEWGDKLNTIEL